MSEEWRLASLGEVFETDNARLGRHDNEPTVFSMSKYDGFVRADEYFDKRIASENLDGYKIVPSNGWAFSTIHIDEGSIALNDLGIEGVVSPMYTTLRWISNADDPRFIALVVKSPSMLNEYKHRAQGTVNRRRSLPYKEFATIEVSLPPLAAQRRIVVVIDSIDKQIAALDAERDAVQRARKSLLKELLRDDTDWIETTLGEVAVVNPELAKGWDLNRIIRYVDIASVNATEGIDTEAVATLAFGDAPGRARRIMRTGDVLVSTVRPNLRAFASVPSSLDGELASTGFAVVRATDRVHPRFVWSIVTLDGFANDMVAKCTGSNYPAIRASDVASFQFRLPPLATQQRIADLIGFIDKEITALYTELKDMRVLRSAVLNALLSREIEIPDSFDELLNTKAAV